MHVGFRGKWIAGAGQISGLFILVFFLLGMGGGSADRQNEGDGLLPQKNFSALISDRKGLKTTAHRLTWEGKIYLKGQYGDATITVPFAKIRQVEFAPNTDSAQPNAIETQIQLQSGSTVKLSLERTSKLYAETEFGQLEIFIKDLQKMEFQP